MFLTTVSAAVVALALIAQATGIDERFRVFALVVLPVVLLLGIATLIRLGDAMEEDVWLLVGMNRLRHAYVDLAPELEPYFVTGREDDVSTLSRRFGGTSHPRPSRVLARTPVIVAIIDAVLAGVLTAVLASTLMDHLFVYASLGVLVGIGCAIGLAGIYPYRSISRLRREYPPVSVLRRHGA